MTIFQAFRRAMLGLAMAAAGALVAVLLFVAWCAYTLPLSHQAAELRTAAVLFVSASGEPFAARGTYVGDKITADQLPQELAHAVVAIEDRRFYRHSGVDLRGIARAALHNLFGRGGTEGGSTITQQLARLAYLSPERTIRRKVQEVLIAVWLESRLSKQEILARYLNEAYFGAGAYGADAAAKRYFGKKAGALNLAEAAMLAGLVRAPSQLAPNRNPEAARHRAELVLDAMLETGVIDREQAQQAREHPAVLAVPPEPEPGQGYFIDAAEAEMRRLIGSPPLDLKITTTLDPRLQDAAERAVERWLAGEGARRNVSQAALIAMAPDGAVLAMVGGRDYRETQFNRATQAHRQPGSLFKVIVYLTALSNGFTPESVMVDRPVQIGDWAPKNFDERYRGPVPLRTAFAQSINTVAAQLADSVGLAKIIETAKSLGIQSELPAVPSLALGTAEVTLLEMTRVMDAIAIDSKSVEPYLVRAIAGQGAAPLYTRSETIREPPPWNRTAMVQLLEAVVNEGTGHAARLDRRAAGKTGTTQDYRDAWFVGFTSDLVAGVWVGNDDNSPMDRVTGGDIPAKIWHDFMSEAERIRMRPVPQTAATAADHGGAPAAAPPTPAVPTAAAETASAPDAAPPPLQGVPTVVDTATLLVQGQTVHLSGVAGEAGEYGEALNRFIGGRSVTCLPTPGGPAGEYHCFIGRNDLARAIIGGGVGRTTEAADPALRAVEQWARARRLGIWE